MAIGRQSCAHSLALVEFLCQYYSGKMVRNLGREGISGQSMVRPCVGRIICSAYPLYWSGTNGDRSGFPSRKPTFGPEEDLVRSFIERLEIRAPKGHEVVLFKEPRLPSGAPDLVAVVWQPQKAADWRPERTALNDLDLRILHWLGSRVASTRFEMARLFGREIDENLGRLRAADMIRTNTSAIRARPISRLFAVKRIYAIEAKVSQIPLGLEQAGRNRWFAQKSFVLIPKMPRGTVLLDRAADLGVGIWSVEDARLDVRQPDLQDGLPVSYASWLFNEWVWRAKLGCGRC